MYIDNIVYGFRSEQTFYVRHFTCMQTKNYISFILTDLLRRVVCFPIRKHPELISSSTV